MADGAEWQRETEKEKSNIIPLCCPMIRWHFPYLHHDSVHLSSLNRLAVLKQRPVLTLAVNSNQDTLRESVKNSGAEMRST